MVRDRLAKLERERAGVLRLIASLDRRHTVPAALLSGSNLSAFTHAFTERLHSPNSSLRKAYIRQLVDRVEVGQSEIRISGSRAALAKGVVAAASGSLGVVPTFVPEWWARQDSNLQPSGYETLDAKQRNRWLPTLETLAQKLLPICSLPIHPSLSHKLII